MQKSSFYLNDAKSMSSSVSMLQPLPLQNSSQIGQLINLGWAVK